MGILLEYCGAAVIATLCVSQGFFALLAIVSLEGSVVHRAAFNSPVTTFEVALGFAAFAAADVALVLLVDRLKKVGGASALPRATDASSSRSSTACPTPTLKLKACAATASSSYHHHRRCLFPALPRTASVRSA